MQSSPTTADPYAIVRECAEILRPPKRLSVVEVADRHVRINVPGGYQGPFRSSTVPYMIRPMELLTSRLHEAVIFAGPAQTRKTFCLIDCWIAHTAFADPTDMAVIQTDQLKARKYSRTRVDRLHESSPQIGARLAPGGQADNVHDKTYRPGNQLFIGWPTKNQLSGAAICKMALTDFDRWDDNIGGEGSGFDLARGRIRTFLSKGMVLVESSPGKEVLDPDWQASPDEPHQAPPAKGILGLYNLGTRERFYWLCMACDEPLEPDDEYLSWVGKGSVIKNVRKAAATAVMVCPHCGYAHTPAMKSDLNHRSLDIGNKGWIAEGLTISRGGKIEGEPRDSTIASFWLKGPAAVDQAWDKLVAKLIQAQMVFDATGDEEPLRSATNIDLAKPYISISRKAGASPQDFLNRREIWVHRLVPEGVRFLTAAIDVQANRFVVQVEGWGVGFQRWIVDRFSITRSKRKGDSDVQMPVNPAAYPEDWDLIHPQVLQRAYLLGDESGRSMPILRAGVDTGGQEGVADRAYEFYRRMAREGLGRRLCLLKGSQYKTGALVRMSKPEVSGAKASKAAQANVPLWILNVHALKDMLAADLKRGDPGPRYIHFGHWLEPWFFEELTGERRTAKGWEKRPGARNESFDLCVYNRALLEILQSQNRGRINWDDPPKWALDWDENPVLQSDASQPEPKKQKRSLAELGAKLNAD